MPDTLWKLDERRVAKTLHGRRTPLSGALSDGTRSDVSAGELYVEVKRRARFAPLDWLQKARFWAQQEGRIGVVVVHVGATQRWVAMLDLRDFQSIAARAGVIPQAQEGERAAAHDAVVR